MEYWIGESPYDKKNKENLYQKASKLKWYELKKSMSFSNTDMIKIMKKAQRGLKKVDLVKMRTEIELERYGHSSYLGSLSENKQSGTFYFFVTMLGYIDSKINEENKYIDFNSKFLKIDDVSHNKTYSESIKKSKERINKMLKDRNEVLEDYNTFMGKSGIDGLFKSVLKEIPSCNKFNKLYEKSLSNSFHQIKLINAYNIGFLDPYGDYEEKMNKYRFLFNDLLTYINSNKAELESIKSGRKMRERNGKRI